MKQLFKYRLFLLIFFSFYVFFASTLPVFATNELHIHIFDVLCDTGTYQDADLLESNNQYLLIGAVNGSKKTAQYLKFEEISNITSGNIVKVYHKLTKSAGNSSDHHSEDDFDDLKKSMENDYNAQGQSCNSLLGRVDDEDSVAWLLQQILNYIKVLGPLLVIILSGLDFAKIIVNSDDKSMAQAQKKLILRLLLAASLFFIPTLVGILLNLFGITSTCELR